MARTSQKKIAIKDEGVTIIQDVDSVNFAGAGVTATASANDATATIPGGGAGSGLDTGMIVDWPGAILGLPSTYAFCNGQALNRTTDAALFAIISTKFGAGNGSTTFNVPDLRNRFRIGADSQDAQCVPTTTIIGAATCCGGNTNFAVDLGALGVSVSDGGHSHNISGGGSITVDTNGDGSTCNFSYTNASSTDSATTGIGVNFVNTTCVVVCNAVSPFSAMYPVIKR